MYEYTDKIISTMNKRFIRIMDRLKRRLASIDEISALLTESEQTIAELDYITRNMLLKAAKKAYKDNGGRLDTIDEMWLNAYLNGLSPVTKYSYTNEVDRKRSRFFETLAASDKDPKELKTALRLWSHMAGEYALEVTDLAVLQAYMENGVEKVRWITEMDGRECSECASRDDMIYLIHNVPPKPHWGCRCILVPEQ